MHALIVVLGETDFIIVSVLLVGKYCEVLPY